MLQMIDPIRMLSDSKHAWLLDSAAGLFLMSPGLTQKHRVIYFLFECVFRGAARFTGKPGNINNECSACRKNCSNMHALFIKIKTPVNSINFFSAILYR